MIVNKQQLTPYLSTGATLIPLHVWNKQTTDKKGKVQKRGKTPINPNWTKSDKNNEATLKRAEKGHNVGYRLNTHDLIIDIDHRNFKDDVDSLEELCKFLDVPDLADICPTVITGSGGYHYYLQLPEDITDSAGGKTGIRETIDKFPGIEFKTVGRQVVCAGSKHPNGNYYEWDEFSPALSDRPMVWQKLIDVLKYTRPTNQVGMGVLDNDQLSRLLVQLPIEKYADNDSWFKIMCASHHATGGSGIEEFLEWSLDDIDYMDDEHLIRCRWESLNQKEVNITVNSLYKDVLTHGGTTDIITAAEDFEGMDFEDDFDAALQEIQTDQTIDTVNTAEEEDKGSIARELAETLHKNSNGEEVSKAIRAALYLKDDVDQVRVLQMISDNSGIKGKAFSDIKKNIKERVSNQINNDQCRMLAELAYEVEFDNGKGLIYSAGEQFWRYNGKCWNIITKKFLEKKVTEVLDILRKKQQIERAENALVIESSQILGRIAAVDNDRLGLRERPRPIINCQNGELWVAEDGSVKLRKHRPESYLLQVLNVTYNPAAECPLFEKALSRTFSKFEDKDDMISMVYEMIGYIIQPNKDLEKWFLFNGKGGDGKSTLIRIISALLGSAVLPESIGTFSRDNHIMSDVPGKLLIVDDDMDKRTKLPDGTIKKLCGRNDLNGNPKGSKTERFTPATTLILSCNGLPRTDDLSEGGRRRPIVIPFNMSFHVEGQGGVLDMAEQVIAKELDGVLNKAIEGLQRLRNRGRFLEPMSCASAKNNWIAESNMNAMFLAECIEVTGCHTDKVYLSDMFAAYGRWCESNSIVNKSGKQHFRQYMEELGLEYTTLGHNTKGFRRVKLVEEVAMTGDFDSEIDFE